jgi:hypothetical protein
MRSASVETARCRSAFGSLVTLERQPFDITGIKQTNASLGSEARSLPRRSRRRTLSGVVPKRRATSEVRNGVVGSVLDMPPSSWRRSRP